jgi:dynein heavy chain
VFPDPGIVYDYYFVKQASGSWGKWMDYVDKKKLEIPKDAKVRMQS